MTKYFKNVQTMEDLKKQFKKLAKQYHPDLGGSDEAMKEINAEYEMLKAQLQRGKAAGNKKTAPDMDGSFREVIMNIVHLDIEIEICGEWIWVSGNTYPYREVLKENGFKWSKPKKMWYWAPYPTNKKIRSNTPMEQIRMKYGSFTVEKEELHKIG